MNLKLKRLVRTDSSEQYALFDLEQMDQEQQPLTIGKLDLHYTGEGVYGTFLLWDETTRQLRPAQRNELIDAILSELTQPMGVPNEYVVEFFLPTLEHYALFHNVELDGEEIDQPAEESIPEDRTFVANQEVDVIAPPQDGRGGRDTKHGQTHSIPAPTSHTL